MTKKILHSLILLSFFLPSGLYSQVISSAPVRVSAEMPVVLEAGITVRDASSHGETAGLRWSGVTGSGWVISDTYVELDVRSNYPAWRVDIYTDNSQAVTDSQRGGLINTADSTKRMPVGWVVSGSTSAALSAGEPGELVRSVITHSGGYAEVPWIYLKDRGDTDDPETGWDEAFSSGYTTVLYGGAEYISLPYGLPAELPVSVFFEADYRYAAGGSSYAATIWFEVSAE